MGLISSHDLTADQLSRCCNNRLTPGIIGYTLLTIDGQRAGVVADVLVDDETMDLHYLVVDTQSAQFEMHYPHILLPTDLCCWDAEHKTVRSQAHQEQMQNASAYDRAIALTRAYEETVFTNFGERPYWPT
jgi:hypothetical protein